MRNFLALVCLFIILYCNCCLFEQAPYPFYYNSFINVIPVSLYLVLYRTKTNFKIDIKWIVLSFISFTLMTLIWGRNNGSTTLLLFSFMFIPQFFRSIQSQENAKYLIIFLFACEAGLCIYEYAIENNVFMAISTITDRSRFRSTGLWAHPLHNASIVSVTILLIIMSNLKLSRKILLLIIGIIVLFTFNGRASIISTSICTLLIVLQNPRQVFKVVRKHPILVGATIIMGIVLFGYLSSTDLGGKMFNAETRNMDDRSAGARFDLYAYVLNMNIEEWLFGFKNFDAIFLRNDFDYIESTQLSLILSMGGLIAIPFMIFQFIDLYHYFDNMRPRYRLIIILDIVVIGLSSESFVGLASWVMIYAAYTALFGNNYIKRTI